MQRALAELKAEGLIVAEPGRGTVFVGRSVQPLDEATSGMTQAPTA